MPNTHAIPFKSFPCTILLLKVYHHEGFSNWYKIDGVVNNYSTSCNYSNDFKKSANIAKDCWEHCF